MTAGERLKEWACARGEAFSDVFDRLERKLDDARTTDAFAALDALHWEFCRAVGLEPA